MRAPSTRRLLGIGVCAIGVVTIVVTAGPLRQAHAAVAPSFAAPITLPGGAGGGEPGIAIDATNCSGLTCHIYVNSPNATSAGPGIWHSSDYGATWGAVTTIDNILPCNAAPGGDTDADVLPNGSVVVDDLDVSWATIQVSTDHATTFPACTETAFEDDRPWLTHKGNNTVYVAYHDFVLEVPVVCTSTTVSGTSAGTFTCIQTYSTPTNIAAGQQFTNCQENTVPARYIAIDPTDSSINFMYSCSTLAENAAAPPYGPLHDYFLAQSTNGIVYNTKNIYVAPTSSGQKPNLANIFGNFHIDSAGNYYAVWVGSLDDSHILTGTPAGINYYHVYLTTSQDKGTTWSPPVAVDTLSGGDGLRTRTLADFAVTTPGNIDLIWYGTPGVGEPNGQCGSTGNTHACVDGTTPDGMDFTPAGGTNTGGPVPGNWKVYMAQSTNALSGSASFTFSQVDPNFRHFGTICTNGIVCGGVSDRHLLDFISVGVDCTGAAHVTYAADQNNPVAPALGDVARHDGTLHAIVTNQNGGNLLAQPATCQQAANTPEAPLVAALPLGALAAGIVASVVRRRRRSAVALI